MVAGDQRRLIWGGRITTRRSEPSDLAQKLKRDMLSVYPQLQDMEITHAWAGTMGYAVHKMPLIRKLGDGVWCATAFGGHGINTTAMAGMLIASAIANDDDRYRLFAPFAPVWAGGFGSRVAVQASYWHMRLRDWIDERRARRAG
ncbi:MAG: FAD-binding oxidoreductase [Caldilineaceae bacterium]|nr:FAD-binding oxidoreductase [Caldilineaceae bacterium]